MEFKKTGGELFLIGLMLVVLTPSIVLASSLSVNPGEYSVDLVGGGSFNKTITVKWTGETNVVGELKTTFSQDGGNFTGKEMWANYSVNPIVLNPNEPKDVNLTINTIPNISPGIYNIKTGVKTEIERRIDHDTDTDYVYITNETAENETEVVNQTKVITKIRNRTVVNNTGLNELNNTISDLEGKLENKTEKNKQLLEERKGIKNVVLILIGLIVLLVVIMVIIMAGK